MWNDSDTDMTILVKCDGCGKVGTPEEIPSDYNGNDFCQACARDALLKELKEQRDSKKEWLERTHLKELGELELKIAEMEQAK